MEKINLGQLKAIKNSGEEAAIIDVLPKDIYQKGHIPGSLNIPLSEDGDFVQQVESIVPSKNYTVVLYCYSPKCDASEKAAKILNKAGFSSVYHYVGGIEEWQQAGEPVEKGKQKKIHTETD